MSGGEREERIRERLEEARRWFRAHHAGVGPAPDFATRVAARLRRDPAEELGRAAMRLLPATLALVLVLAWLAAGAGPDPSATQPAADPDLVSWVYGQTEAGP
jgi:hypothetical protein